MPLYLNRISFTWKIRKYWLETDLSLKLPKGNLNWCLPTEIKKCLHEVTQDAYSIEIPELFKEVCSRFGFGRTTESMKSELDRYLKEVIKSGLLKLEENKLSIA